MALETLKGDYEDVIKEINRQEKEIEKLNSQIDKLTKKAQQISTAYQKAGGDFDDWKSGVALKSDGDPARFEFTFRL